MAKSKKSPKKISYETTHMFSGEKKRVKIPEEVPFDTVVSMGDYALRLTANKEGKIKETVPLELVDDINDYEYTTAIPHKRAPFKHNTLSVDQYGREWDLAIRVRKNGRISFAGVRDDSAYNNPPRTIVVDRRPDSAFADIDISPGAIFRGGMFGM